MPKNVQLYFERRHISELFEDLMTAIIKDTPKHPVPYLIQELEKKLSEKERDRMRQQGRADTISVASTDIGDAPSAPVVEETISERPQWVTIPADALASSDDESEEEDEADRSRAESAITLEVSPSALPSAQQTVPKATKYDLTDDEDNEEEEEDAIVLPENPADFEGEIGTENVMTRISGETSTPSGVTLCSRCRRLVDLESEQSSSRKSRRLSAWGDGDDSLAKMAADAQAAVADMTSESNPEQKSDPLSDLFGGRKRRFETSLGGVPEEDPPQMSKTIHSETSEQSLDPKRPVLGSEAAQVWGKTTEKDMAKKAISSLLLGFSGTK